MGNEYYLLNPSEQKFYKIIATWMGVIGLNTEYWNWYEPSKRRIYAVQRKIVIIFVPVALVSMIMYLSTHYHDLEFAALATILSVMPFTSSVACKVLTAQTESYKIANTNFMNNIHLHTFVVQNFAKEKLKFVQNLLIETEKNTRYCLYSLTLVALPCCASWVFVPMIHNIQNNHSIHNITVRLELGLYFWQPFNNEYNFRGYVISQIIVVYCGFAGTFVFFLFDTLNLAFVFHLTGHIKIFKYDLMMGQNEVLSDIEWEKKLKEISLTYSFIINTFKNVETTFGFNVASIYAQNLVQGGILLYQFTTSGRDMGVVLTFGLMIPLFMGTLIVLSVILENVRIQADDIPNLVYALPWESMSIKNQKLVQNIIFQVQPTLEYKAAFNTKTGVQPAINIIKTTFSYYVMIKSRKEM